MTRAALLRRRGIIGSSFAIVPPTVLTSDAFTGGNDPDIHGRNTDCALGGAPVAWVKGTVGSRLLGITSGALVPAGGSATNIYALNVGTGAIRAYATIAAAITGSGQSMSIIGRQDGTLSQENCYRATVQAAGTIVIQRVIAGAATNISALTHNWSVGDTFGLAMAGNLIGLYHNGATVELVIDNQWGDARGRCGVRATNTAAGALQAFTVEDVNT